MSRRAFARRKVTHYIHLADRDVFGFAGLWDRCHSEEGAWIESCTMLTMPGNELLAKAALAALHAYPSKLMTSHEVSTV